MRPANLAVRLPDSLEGDVELMTARPADPADLAQRLWDLAAWSEQARDLSRELNALAPDGPEALAPGFELSAAVLRHLQADPLLPPELLPADWPGATLRTTYDRWDLRYRTTLRDWSRAG
jgi:phenylacetic acid degradation operon negative regulatory protein